MLMLHLNRNRHYLPRESTEASKTLERVFPRSPLLFIYWHANTHNYVVAQWISKARGLASEILTLGRTPTFTAEQIMTLRRQLQPRAVKEVRDNLRAMEQARARQDAEDDALREDLLAKLIRDAHPGPGARPMLYVPAPKKVIV
jgi:hypothetical protein